MNRYKLLTPGPLTTSESVRHEMMFDRCTWDDEYKSMTQKIRKELLKLANVEEMDYTVVLMQGSGSFGVEATLNTVIGKDEKCLFVINGDYGERMLKMAEYMGMDHIVYSVPYNQIPEKKEIIKILEKDKAVTHVAMVHCETTTGILNPIEMVSEICEEYAKSFILDAMSSFGGIEIDMSSLNIDYLISSANKCIQGVPGFSFVLAKKDKLMECEGKATSLVLDLFDQWKGMDKDGKWRYTSPTHVVAAFSKAIDELVEEGGIKARQTRYEENNKILIENMKKMGLNAYICEEHQSPIITTFLFPTPDFDFDEFYTYVKERGFVLYPGKLTNEKTFRVGNIGEIYAEDIRKISEIIRMYMEGIDV